MIQVQIITVGKLKEKYWLQAMNEYMKRLGSYAKVQIAEVADEKAPESASAAEENLIKHKEGERILAVLKPDSFVFALAIDGGNPSSEELAKQLEQLAIYGRSHVTFIIGGSLGLSDAVLQRADQQLSFGRMTFPHQMMRVILLEQVYRAFKIIRGEPYHK
jgi:23S rRNA (pseudouridine1915-N3)-methyltransferase